MKNNKLLGCLIASLMVSNAANALSSEKNPTLEERIKYLENRLGMYEANENFPSFSDMGRQFDEMARMFQEQMALLDKSFEKYNSTLKVNKLKDKIEIIGNFPEYEKDEIEIKTTDDFIIISANKKKEVKNDNENYYSSNYNSFYQSVRLPYNAMTNKISTEYKDKKLKITVPLDVKKEKVRLIKIK